MGKGDQGHELAHVRVRSKNTSVIPRGSLGKLPDVLALSLPPPIRDRHLVAAVGGPNRDHVVDETHRATDWDVAFLWLRLERSISAVPNDGFVVAVLDYEPLERIDRPPNLKIIPKT